MITTHRDYQIDDSPARLDLPRIYAWLTSTYWWQYGLTPDKLERGIRHSALVVGVYQNDEQVAFCRVVSDTMRFAWLADVFVGEPHRNKGLARAMVRYAIDHPQLADVARWLLATRDAHAVYQGLGFGPLTNPAHMMELRREPSH
jgi:GNAT superfamily N-acetyltransferase